MKVEIHSHRLLSYMDSMKDKYGGSRWIFKMDISELVVYYNLRYEYFIEGANDVSTPGRLKCHKEALYSLYKYEFLMRTKIFNEYCE